MTDKSLYSWEIKLVTYSLGKLPFHFSTIYTFIYHLNLMFIDWKSVLCITYIIDFTQCVTISHCLLSLSSCQWKLINRLPIKFDNIFYSSWKLIINCIVCFFDIFLQVTVDEIYLSITFLFNKFIILDL